MAKVQTSQPPTLLQLKIELKSIEPRIWRRVIVPSTERKRHAVCVAGENACPPEGVGGPYGYASYLVAIGDENQPRHEAMIEWGGEGFDPAAFDLEQTNAILKHIRV